MKKRRPIDIINKRIKTDPNIEHAFSKFIGKELQIPEQKGEPIRVTSYNNRLANQLGISNYSELHTHPYDPTTWCEGIVSPSLEDINSLLSKSNTKHSYIIQQNTEKGEAEGVLVLSKTRKTPKLDGNKLSVLKNISVKDLNVLAKEKLITRKELGCYRALREYYHQVSKRISGIGYLKTFGEMTKRLGLKWSFLPIEGYCTSIINMRFEEKDKKEENITLPSATQFENFLFDPNSENISIKQYDPKRKRTKGRLVLKKKDNLSEIDRKTYDRIEQSPQLKEQLIKAGYLYIEDVERLTSNLRKDKRLKGVKQTEVKSYLILRDYKKDTNPSQLDRLSKLSEEFGLDYEFVPEKGYKLCQNGWKLVKERSLEKRSLENKLTAGIMITSLAASFILSYQSLTGNIISNLPDKISSSIGIIFLL